MARKKPENHTGRTLKWLRDRGDLCDVVEYWLPSHASRAVVDAAVSGDDVELATAIEELKRYGPGRRRDLFGFIDVVSLSDTGIVAVQVTSHDAIASRVNKIRTECEQAAKRWLECGGRVEVWGWKKHSKAVNRKLWRPTIREFELASNGAVTVKASEDVELFRSD